MLNSVVLETDQRMFCFFLLVFIPGYIISQKWQMEISLSFNTNMYSFYSSDNSLIN